MAATRREKTGKGPNRRLRVAGSIPGVVYGMGAEPFSVAVVPREIVLVLNSPMGRNTVLDLTLEGGGSHKALIRDFQIDPVRRNLLHVDFQSISESEEVIVDVPLNLIGVSPFVLDEGAQGTQVAQTVRVSCLPAAIPEGLPVDISHVDRPMVIYAETLEFAEGITPKYRHDFPIAVFAMGRVEEEPEEELEEGEEGEEGAEGEGEGGDAAAPSDAAGGDAAGGGKQ